MSIVTFLLRDFALGGLAHGICFRSYCSGGGWAWHTTSKRASGRIVQEVVIAVDVPEEISKLMNMQRLVRTEPSHHYICILDSRTYPSFVFWHLVYTFEFGKNL